VSLVFHTQGHEQPKRSKQRRQLAEVRNVVALCHEMRQLRRLCIFSTAFVSGSRSGVILEEELEEGQRLRTPFERSMFTIERFARGHMPRLPITVCRPSAMIGHSRTDDAGGLTEGPGYLLGLMLRLPTDVPFFLPGAGVVPFNIVPVDYVVDAAWTLADHPAAAGRTFHLTDPNPMNARQAFELLAEIANRPTPLFGRWAASAFKGFLRSTGLVTILPRSWVVLDDLTRHVTYSCTGALELLADTDVVCPPFDAYADTLVRWMDRYERGVRGRSNG
jgi:nucleoside-diphosphate-sugar epimerase